MLIRVQVNLDRPGQRYNARTYGELSHICAEVARGDAVGERGDRAFLRR